MLKCPTNFLLIIDLKSLLISLRELMGRCCDMDERLTAFLKKGYTVDLVTSGSD